MYQHMHEESIKNYGRGCLYMKKEDILCVNNPGGGKTCTGLMV
jgi:hypothetical protein